MRVDLDTAAPEQETPATSYRWVILAVGCLSQLAFGELLVVAAALSPAIESKYSLSLSHFGVVLAAVEGGSVITLLSWGICADWIGERIVIGLGTALSAASLVLAAYARSGVSFTITLALAGAFGASVPAASGRAMMSWFGSTERGLALGIRQTSSLAGQALAAATLPLIYGTGGIRVAMLSLAGLLAVSSSVTLIWMRNASSDPDHADSRALRETIVDADIWRISLGSAILAVPQLALISFVVLFLHQEHSFSVRAAAGVLAGMTAGAAATRVAVGYVSDRLKSRLVPLRQMTLGIFAALLCVRLSTPGPTQLLVGFLLLAGMIAAGWNGLSYTAIAERAGPRRSGVALGLQQTVLAGSGALTPILFQHVLSATSWSVTLAFLPIFPLLAYPFFVSSTRRQHLEGLNVPPSD